MKFYYKYFYVKYDTGISIKQIRGDLSDNNHIVRIIRKCSEGAQQCQANSIASYFSIFHLLYF